MLTKPSSCSTCPLASAGTGFSKPVLSSFPYGVALIGDSLWDKEAETGEIFQGGAGFRLTRLLEWAGLDKSRFDLFNTVWCAPPENKLEGQPYESASIAHCRQAHWERFLNRSRVLVPMGNAAANHFIGRKGILNTRGYLYPGPGQSYVLPTVHPTFIQRGQSKWSAAFIQDVQKAVAVATDGIPAQFTDYLLDPSPAGAYQWAQRYRGALILNPRLRLAFDIETPGKDEEEDGLDLSNDGLPDSTWTIWRVGFSYGALSALSIPWEPPFIPAIRLLLESPGEKVVWNAGFDVPRIRRAGVGIHGTIHDGMVAWHILHSDLPKRLGFVATFTCPWQPAWKHLSGSKPAFYNATDADVEWRSMEVIEAELRRVGLWDVYVRDVIELQPVLDYMSQRGMRVDPVIRAERATELASRLSSVRSELENLVPLEARRIEHVYQRPPADTTGLLTRRGTRNVLVCPVCGLKSPRKDHFKTFVRKSNSCAGERPVSREIEVDEYYRLAEFKLSRNLLISYHQHLKRPLPLVWDRKEGRKKVSFDEEQIKKLILKYPDDPLYSLVLEYRGLDKLAGTYIGRPEVPSGN